MRNRAGLIVFSLLAFLGLVFFLSPAYGPYKTLSFVSQKTENLAASSLDLKKLETKTAAVNGITLGYRTIGRGEPLLLIMGYAGTMDVWAPQMIEALASEYKVIMFDNRGMGTSKTSLTPFSISLFASDALGLMDALKIEKAHILGWSMGSLIAQEMVLTAPDRIGKVVLYGTFIETRGLMKTLKAMDKMSTEQFVARLFPEDWAKLHPEVFKNLPAPAQAPDPQIVKKQKAAIGGWRGSASRLGKIRNDTLIVVGEEDDISPPAQGLAVVKKIKGSWLTRFKGAGHWLMYQAPLTLAQTVLLFLDSKENLLH